MSHLLAISVGPVQEFIAAARRTRDLWFGSYLLSEISRAVAKAVQGQGGQLIFPASLTAPSIANKVLAEVNEPKTVAAAAKRAATVCWEQFAKQARDELDKEPVKVIVPDIWDKQLPDVIEFYAAWVARTTNYHVDRLRVERLLTGRKNCRDFLPAKGQAGVPKSSLDGQRESVLLQPPRGVDRKTFRDNWPKTLRLSSGEELDVIGVTKRLGKKKDESDPRYPSVARVAAETWLQGVNKQGKLQPLKAACQKLVSKELNTVREERYQDFPYEGTVIYPDRHPDLREELRLSDKDLDEVAAVLKDIGGEPSPYLAVLVADGDKMGEAIFRLDSPTKHREFSEALAGFADEARRITNGHHGVLVYAGGDDVLAFVPVNKCLDCARQLHDKFAELLKVYGSRTLSVGLAIGHFMENLEDLLEYGRAAAKDAKQPDRDGLAVHLYKRGGSPVEFRAKWNDNPDRRLLRFADLINNKTIPGKLPYELRAMAHLYKDWPIDQAEAAIKIDLVRLVAKKQAKGIENVKEKLAPDLIGMNATKLLGFAKELLVARHIAEALRQAEAAS